MNIVIDIPQEKHAEEIAKICSIGWMQTVEGKLSEAYQTINVDFWYNPERVKGDIKKGVYSHIALLDSKVVGVIGGGMMGPSVGEIYVLYVDENYRYKGIGRQLLEEQTQLQKDKGATEQWVSVQEGNQRGIPFYEAKGFLFREKRIEITKTKEEQVSLRYSRQIDNSIGKYT